MMYDKYYSPYGFIGIGSDIGWCGKAHGGKKCMLCRHYAEFDEWSTKWHWHYLLRWMDACTYYYQTYAHTKYSWTSTWHVPLPYRIKPVRYRTRGLKERDFKQLMRGGCKDKRKCKCVSIAQRGSWYCPDCWLVLNRMAKYRMVNVHDIMIADHDEIKTEMLTLQLAGIL